MIENESKASNRERYFRKNKHDNKCKKVVSRDILLFLF